MLYKDTWVGLLFLKAYQQDAFSAMNGKKFIFPLHTKTNNDKNLPHKFIFSRFVFLNVHTNPFSKDFLLKMSVILFCLHRADNGSHTKFYPKIIAANKQTKNT